MPVNHCPEGGLVTPVPSGASPTSGCEIGPLGHSDRIDATRGIRLEAAHCPHEDPRCISVSASPCEHPCNGDETYYHSSPTLPDGITANPFIGEYPASFTKGLPHDPASGLGEPAAYELLLEALATADPSDFERVRPLGCEEPVALPLPPVPPGQRRLENPQAAFALEMEGADPQSLLMPPAPCFASERQAAEIAEDYWMALCRDVPFIRYATDPRIAQAVVDLNGNFYPHLSPNLDPLTPQTIFRGPTAGDRVGPYLSQFLLHDVPYGAQLIPAAIRTLLPGIDFLTEWDDWLDVQNGCDADQTNCDPVLRLIRSGRDLAQFVHVDRDYNAFFSACHQMLSGRDPLRRCEARSGFGVPFGPCLPYPSPFAPPVEEFPGKSGNQLGFGTFGDQHIKSVLVGATFRAFHAVWFQKWSVHRRLRPEEFGGRVHLSKLSMEDDPAGQPFPVNPILFNSALFAGPAAAGGPIFEHNARQNANLRNPRNVGTYLLPMAYAEGSPLHPSYGSGHSTVAGCLATILKAFFHNDWVFQGPVEPNEDGTSVRFYTGSDVLTVAGELDKLASNIGLGRVWAGVHWRSDHEESLLLGEQVAIGILCDQRQTFNEAFEFRFRSFDFGPYQGKVVRIRPPAVRWENTNSPCEPCVELLQPDEYERVCERRRRPEAPY